MSRAPQHTNPRCCANPPLAANDCRNRHHVIRIGRMPHSEKETQGQHRKQANRANLLFNLHGKQQHK
jgi:hypothetical protein